LLLAKFYYYGLVSRTHSFTDQALNYTGAWLR